MGDKRSIYVTGSKLGDGPTEAPRLAGVDVRVAVDVSRIEPTGVTCVGFAGVVGGPAKRVTRGSVTVEISHDEDRLAIVELPRPANAHVWLPDPMRVLATADADGGPHPLRYRRLVVAFESPVKWVRLCLAPGAFHPEGGSYGTLYGNPMSSTGSSPTKSPQSVGPEPFVFETMRFSATDVFLSEPEFSPPELRELGDVKRVVVEGFVPILLWEVCFWPA